MGILTFRRVGKVRKDVKGLRAELTVSAGVQSEMDSIAVLREAIADLPPEGKAEIDALRTAYLARGDFMQGWTRKKFVRQQWGVVRRYL